MNILAFDTSSTACTVALTVNGQQFSEHTVAPMQQAQLILPMIDAILKKADIKLKDLNAIAFGVGPGSFTGLRIAASVAQGLGFATRHPLIPLSSLHILAATAQATCQAERFLIAIDARIQQVYWAVYEQDQAQHLQLVGEECLLAPETIPLTDNDKTAIGLGDGWDKYRAIIQTHNPLPSCRPDLLPNAIFMLPLAERALTLGATITAAEVSPVYLAKPQLK